MSVQAILDIVIGLVFMYLLLSLVATSVSEMIAAITSMRAKSLKDGIQKLLNDPDASALYSDFVSHPLIKTAHNMAGRHGPSYLSSQAFSLALLDKIAPGAPQQNDQLFDHVRKGIDRIPDGTAKGVLEAFAKEAQGDVEKLKRSVAAWFDDGMDRVAGVYKRKVQAILLMIGVVISFMFNADTFMVASKLWQDAGLRAEISGQASGFIDANVDVGYAEASAQLKAFPIGWTAETVPVSTLGWIAKVLGLLVTAMTVALGAPFWFDVLSRVNAIRSAGPKPRRSSDAA